MNETLKKLWNEQKFWIGFIIGAIVYQTIMIFLIWGELMIVKGGFCP